MWQYVAEGGAAKPKQSLSQPYRTIVVTDSIDCRIVGLSD